MQTLAALSALALMAGSVHAVTLFADTFDRANSTDLNAAAAGKSGSLGALNWIEKTGGAAGVTAQVNNNTILLGELGGGSSGWAIAFPDYNFSNATLAYNGEFTVSVDWGAVSSSGGTRFAGFGVGNSLAELNAWNYNNPSSTFTSDFFIGYDPTGTTEVKVFKNSTTQDYQQAINLSSGGSLSVRFSGITDFNSGSTVNYEAFINGGSVKTGTFTWSGMDENYIFLYSNYSNSGGRLDNFEVSTVPEPTCLALMCLGGLLFARRRRA